MERESETIRLDSHGGVDRGEVVPLPANFGEDSAGLYPAAHAKSAALSCYLIYRILYVRIRSTEALQTKTSGFWL
jgi:hypothetical protein